jgi:DNA-binding NtrC family response regulator
MGKLNILVVDDEKGYRDEISEYLQDCGFGVATAETPAVALELASGQDFDIAVLDLRLPRLSGIELMQKLHEHDPELGVIIISGHGDMDSVISALRQGALDFFPKPFDLNDIRFAIERTRKYLELSEDLNAVRRSYENLLQASEPEGRYRIIGSSGGIGEVVRLMDQVSASPETDVLITGESGTGKELVARGIHLLSHKYKQAFFDVNCTAIPETLFESEFFGHARNAFTGAQAEKMGWFEVANGGTLFLDEIGDLPLPMQAKLLRVLEERRIRRVGSNRDISLRIRVIASTNRDLRELIARKLFREDLYYRLNRFAIHIPPLRDRPEDILPLLQFYKSLYLNAMNKADRPLSEKALERLTGYSYPGNVRELKNLMEKAVILCKPGDRELNLSCFPEFGSSSALLPPSPDCLDLNALDELEKGMIVKAMQKAGNNKTKAAELLNITRTGLNRRIARYGLEF